MVFSTLLCASVAFWVVAIVLMCGWVGFRALKEY